MIIKPYGDLPRTYAPDVGEVIEARRSHVGKFVRAVTLHVRRRGSDTLEIKVQWLESDPDACVTPPRSDRPISAPIIAGAVGWVRDRRIEDAPPLIRQISGGAAD